MIRREDAGDSAGSWSGHDSLANWEIPDYLVAMEAVHERRSRLVPEGGFESATLRLAAVASAKA
jgi:hypothetical protein